MKHAIFLMMLIISAKALAISECAGRAADGSFVMVHVNTTGATATPDEGEVSIEQGDNKFGYRFTKAEMPQFFEYDDASNGSAMVGIAAYVTQEFPVSVKYVGPNYVDMDLKAVLDEGKVDAGQGNFLRVWKGPGHPATDQYQVLKIVCAVWSNI